jgi:hypothetical protein
VCSIFCFDVSEEAVAYIFRVAEFNLAAKLAGRKKDLLVMQEISKSLSNRSYIPCSLIFWIQ